jgi:hypothetical protein
VLVEVASAVLRSKAALQQACMADDWDEAVGDSAAAAEFSAIVSRKCFWKRLKLVVELLQPVKDAIHKVEGDVGLLSQALPVWRQLVKHFMAWQSRLKKDTALKADNVVSVILARRDKSLPAAAGAAFLLDPIFIQKDSSNPKRWAAPFGQLSAAQKKGVKATLLRLVGGAVKKQALDNEWAQFKLGALTGDITEDLPYLTQQQEGPDGSIIVPSVAQRLAWWGEAAATYPLLAAAARCLLPRHVTSCASERNWSVWGNTYTKLRNKLAIGTAEKMIFIAGNKGVVTHKPTPQVLIELLEDGEASE